MAKKVKVKANTKGKKNKNEKKKNNKQKMRFILSSSLLGATAYIYKPATTDSYNVFYRTEKTVENDKLNMARIVLPATAIDTAVVKRFYEITMRSGELMEPIQPYRGKDADVFFNTMVEIIVRLDSHKSLLYNEVCDIAPIVELFDEDNKSEVYRIINVQSDTISWKKITKEDITIGKLKSAMDSLHTLAQNIAIDDACNSLDDDCTELDCENCDEYFCPENPHFHDPKEIEIINI